MLFKLSTSIAILASIAKSLACDDVQARFVTAAEGCTIASELSPSPGFRVRMFEFDLWDYIDFNNKDWVANSYTTQYCSTTLQGVTEPNFSLDFDLFNPSTELYGVYNRYDHFLNEYTGYFYAQETGIYTLGLNSADDGAMFWLGSNKAFGCCNPVEIPYGTSDDVLLSSSKPWLLETSSSSSFIYLESGYYYPMRIVYTNTEGNSVLEFDIQTPSGIVITNFKDYVYSLNSIPDGLCSTTIASNEFDFATTTSTWTGQYTTTVYSKETTRVNGVLSAYVIEDIVVPEN